MVCSTAAQNPWSNGLNKKHNSILREILKKTTEDRGCNLRIAITLTISVKNAFHSITQIKTLKEIQTCFF